MHGKQQNHKPTNQLYRKAILKAIEGLHDCHLRSSVGAIRRHVISALEDQHPWNEVVFMKTLKVIVHDGEVEQHTFVNCALSPEYKKRKMKGLAAFLDQKRGQGFNVTGQVLVPYIPETDHPPTYSAFLPINAHLHPPSPESPKQAPKRKVEHDKYKIMPKPLFDRTTQRIHNPMDTR